MEVKELGANKFDLGGGQMTLEIGKSAADKAYMRNNNEVVIPLLLKAGENTINLRYSWN